MPFVITVGDQHFVDYEDLDLQKMLHDMEQEKEASHTACPAPGTWLQHFEKASHTFAITISSQVSGSVNSALTAMDMALEKHPEKKK